MQFSHLALEEVHGDGVEGVVDGLHDGAQHVVGLVDLHGVLLGEARVTLLVHAGLRLGQHIRHHPQRKGRPQQTLRLHASNDSVSTFDLPMILLLSCLHYMHRLEKD